jgi:hypothetical protein
VSSQEEGTLLTFAPHPLVEVRTVSLYPNQLSLQEVFAFKSNLIFYKSNINKQKEIPSTLRLTNNIASSYDSTSSSPRSPLILDKFNHH